ncbi:sulfotransferase family protein [Haliea sp. E17]|uniref:sulfotransferase family protein n=1 Tax=Haliea sp. E17 TaxID=3401576 RepID=UPI003AACE58D
MVSRKSTLGNLFVRYSGVFPTQADLDIISKHRVRDWSTRTYLLNRFARGISVKAPPVFIVGCGHSGTSLLLAILGTHSNLYPVPFESYLIQQPNRRAYLHTFDLLTVATGKTRWVEKTPRHIRHIDELLAVHPRAKVIIMLRDGRDVATSLFKRTGDLEGGIQRWVADNRSGDRFIEHPRVHRFRYEDIVTDFKGTMVEILGFISEDYEYQMARFDRENRYFYSNEISRPPDQTEANHLQFRNWQINQPLFDGRGQWRTLPAEQQHIIFNTISSQLSEYGYLDSSEGSSS